MVEGQGEVKRSGALGLEGAFNEVGARGDAGLGEQDDFVAEGRVELGEAPLLDLGLGEAVFPLGIGLVDFGPWRRQEHLPAKRIGGEGLAGQWRAGERALGGEGVDQAAIEEGPTGIRRSVGVIGLRHGNDAVDEGACIGPGQGAAAACLLLANDAAARLRNRAVTAEGQFIDQGRLSAA